MVADEDELLAGTGDSHVELAVDEMAIGFDGLREDGKLPGGMNDGGKDDDVALRTLKTLYGVDGDVLVVRHLKRGKSAADEGDLTTEGNDDTEGS